MVKITATGTASASILAEYPRTMHTTSKERKQLGYMSICHVK